MNLKRHSFWKCIPSIVLLRLFCFSAELCLWIITGLYWYFYFFIDFSSVTILDVLFKVLTTLKYCFQVNIPGIIILMGKNKGKLRKTFSGFQQWHLGNKIWIETAVISREKKLFQICQNRGEFLSHPEMN